jgi:peptide/nickel transport system substrate-binding protein
VFRSRAAALALALLCACRAAPPRSDVVIAWAAEPATLYPHATNDEYATAVLSNVYEPLVESDARLDLRPVLAESWHNPDERTWVFRLREGVKLHDGRTLTSEQVAASLEATRSDPRSKRQAELAAVESITARGRDVVIRTRYPFAALPNRLGSAPVWVDTPAARPVGTGRYLVKSWTSEAVVLEGFEGHRDGLPEIRTMTFAIVPDEAEQLRRLRSGKVDMVLEVGRDEALAVASEPGLRIQTQRGLLVHFLVPDLARASSPHLEAPTNPLRDVRVRRAIALSLDLPGLVRDALGGRGDVASQIVAPEVFGHDESLGPRPHDPVEARRLLAEAGVARGFRVQLDYLGPDGDPVAARLAADLRAVGIDAAPRPNPPLDLLKRIEARDVSLYVMPWISTSGDAGLSAAYLLHSPGGGYGLDNGGGYESPVVDRLIEDASRTLDPTRRRALLFRMARQVHDDVAVIPLYRQVDIYALRQGLEFEARLDRQVRGDRMRWGTIEP